MKTDGQLKQEVEEELDWDAAVTATDIGVEVTNGVVTLSGHPPSLAEKLAAEKAAQRVAGVKAVVVDLEVRLSKPDQHSDEDVASAVHAILYWSVAVPREAVKIQVEKGWVTLTGEVGSYAERKVARGVAWSTPGVCAVVDDLVVE